MFKRFLLATILILGIATSFAFQTGTLSGTAKQNTGIVYGANGPLAGAYVYADPASDVTNGSAFAMTDASGHYSMTNGLTAGTYNISAFAFGYITSQIGFVNVTASQTTAGVDFDLQASGGISGLVTDAVNSNPINGTNLYAVLSNGTEAFGWFGTSGLDGSYLVATNLGTGTYNVTIFQPPDGYISQMTTVDVVAGIETKNVNLQLARSGIISGKVTMPNGTGLFGIDVSAFASSGSTFYFGSGKTDSSGNYGITTGLGTGNYTVYASGAGNLTAFGGLLTPTPVLVTAGQETSGIDVELTPVTTPPTPTGIIAGRITDQDSNPVRSATVTASGTGGAGFGESDNNGYYNISSGLGDGNDYNITASATGYYDAYYPALVSVTVDQTTANINIVMTALPPQTFGTITGTVTGAPNPIIPEFQGLVIEVLSLTLATAIVSALTLKTRRYRSKLIPH